MVNNKGKPPGLLREIDKQQQTRLGHQCQQQNLSVEFIEEEVGEVDGKARASLVSV